MITDQTQTGVPSGNAFKTQGINQRTQLVKPTQATNFGRSVGSGTNTTAQPRYNPLRPNTQTAATTANQTGTQIVKPVVNTSAATQPVASTQAQTQTTSQRDIARNAIKQMSDSDLVALLDEIANGSLRGGSL